MSVVENKLREYDIIQEDAEIDIESAVMLERPTVVDNGGQCSCESMID